MKLMGNRFSRRHLVVGAVLIEIVLIVAGAGPAVLTIAGLVACVGLGLIVIGLILHPTPDRRFRSGWRDQTITGYIWNSNGPRARKMMWDGLRIVFLALVIAIPAAVYVLETETGPFELTTPLPAAQNTNETTLPPVSTPETSDASIAQSNSLNPTPTSGPVPSIQVVQTPTFTPPPPTQMPPPVNGLIGFISQEAGKTFLYLADVDGGNLTRLVETDSFGWSPDGKQIAYVCRVPNTTSSVICAINIDGSNKVVTSNETQNGFRETAPAWSPDGESIAFVDGDARQIRFMDVDGTNRRWLEGTPYGVGVPDWSPDGSLIAFMARRSNVSALYVGDPLAISWRGPLTQHVWNEGGFSWAPDGEWLGFLSDNGGYDIWKIRPDGTDLTRITNSKDLEIDAIWWSPDNQLIAFRILGNLYLVSPDGGNPTQLTTHGRVTYNVSWSPDSTLLAYTSRQGEQVDISVVSSDGSTEYNLTQGLNVYFSGYSGTTMAWQPGQR